MLHYAACMERGQRPGALVSEALREGRGMPRRIHPDTVPIPCCNFIVFAIHSSSKSIWIKCVLFRTIPADSAQVPWSPRPSRKGGASSKDPPRHCREACHKMHTITTLTTDDQWIWPVSPRPGADMELLLQRQAVDLQQMTSKTQAFQAVELQSSEGSASYRIGSWGL